MTLKQLNIYILESLTPAVGINEAKAMARVILEDVALVDPVRLALSPDTEVAPSTEAKIRTIVGRVLGGEPLQYVLGTTIFHGMRLSIAPGVLIPRPETSALVDIVVSQWGTQPDLQVLDLGTGSGAIAIALAKSLAFPNIIAVDNSTAALKIARVNCERLNVSCVNLVQMDMLSDTLPPGPFHIIISNPPYVLSSEATAMSPRVLDHEPHSALFVADADPLIYYRTILCAASTALCEQGKIYFEINPSQVQGMRRLLLNNRFRDIDILRDYKGQYRYAIATRPDA